MKLDVTIQVTVNLFFSNAVENLKVLIEKIAAENFQAEDFKEIKIYEYSMFKFFLKVSILMDFGE